MGNIEDINELEAMFTGDGGVPLSRAWINRILKESNYNVNEAASRIMDHITNGTNPDTNNENGAAVNEGDVIANNNADDDSVIEADVMSGEGEDLQGRAKKSRRGTPQKLPPPVSERDAVAGLGSFSTPVVKAGGDAVHGGRGEGGDGGEIVDITLSMRSAQLEDSMTVNNAPSEGVTLCRDDAEEDTKIPTGVAEAEVEEINGRLLISFFSYYIVSWIHTQTYSCRCVPTDSEEEDPSSGPNDLPVGAILLQPPRVIVPKNEDMSMFHGRAASRSLSQQYIDFVRSLMGPFGELVPSTVRNADAISMKSVIQQRHGEKWLYRKQERLTGFNFSKRALENFSGRLYFKSSNGLSYELDKRHWSVQTQLYVSLCNCKVDLRQQREAERRKIQEYIAGIHAGEEPSIDTSVPYGKTVTKEEARSKTQTKFVNEMREEGLVPMVDAWNAQVVEEGRFIDDLWDVAQDADLDYAMFTTPMKIVQALGGDYGNLSDDDVKKYRGCIVTNLKSWLKKWGWTNHLSWEV